MAADAENRFLKWLPVVLVIFTALISWQTSKITTEFTTRSLERDKLDASRFVNDSINRWHREYQISSTLNRIESRLDTVDSRMKRIERALCRNGISGTEC
jgi:hypothetical protein